MDTCLKRILLLVFVVLSVACDETPDSNTDDTLPEITFTVNHADNSVLNPNSFIEIVFSESIEIDFVDLSGVLSDTSNNGVWSTAVVSNDTLTISPATSWDEGSGYILSIDINNSDGVNLESIVLTYNIDATLPHVISTAPVSASEFGAGQQIVINFDEAMDASSLSISGSLATESDSGIWTSSGSLINNSLTITPVTSWSAGNNQTLSIDASDIAGNPISTLNLIYDVNVTSPVITSINLSNGSIINAGESIVIIFDRSMDTGSLVTGGNMSAESSIGVWTTTLHSNDTLTISPATVWETGYWDGISGLPQSLVVDASDTLGNSFPTLILNYTVDVVSISTTGDDTSPGTRSLPLQTINAAISFAEANGYTNVYVQTGDYSEAVSLINGIHIKGGFDLAWEYDHYSVAGHEVNIIGASSGAVIAQNLTDLTQINNLIITAANVTGEVANVAASTYGVRVIDSNNLEIDDVTIVAGNAADGANGLNGVSATGYGEAGADGQNAASFSTVCNDFDSGQGGAGGAVGSLRAGGVGGKGGVMDTLCTGEPPFYFGSDLDASMGEIGGNAAMWSSGVDGQGGAGGHAMLTSCLNINLNGRHGSTGTNGQIGADGIAATNVSGIVVDGYWIVQSHGGDGEPGADGMGGGGGGGSGACDESIDTYGAGGGGGGAGGMAALDAGYGGKAGGYSFGILAVNSSLVTTNLEITLGVGGNGGDGGAGAYGQSGGSPGQGGNWLSDASNLTVGGGDGGPGGEGGNSGAGAGGAGGSAYGIYSESSVITSSNTIYSGGAAGVGGLSGGFTAEAGQNGMMANSNQ